MSTAEVQHSERARTKCRQCRVSKKKCLPLDRRWPGERCDYCTQHDRACGPSERAYKATTPTQHHDTTNRSQAGPSTPGVVDSLREPSLLQDTETNVHDETMPTDSHALQRSETCVSDPIGNQDTILIDTSPMDSVEVPSAAGYQIFHDLAKKQIDAKIIEMGDLLDTIDSLRIQVKAVAEVRPLDISTKHSQLETSIVGIKYLSDQKFVENLANAVNALQPFVGDDKELRLMRIAYLLDSFVKASAIEQDQSNSVTDFGIGLKLLEDVTHQLIAIYEQKSDKREESRRRRELSELLMLSGAVDYAKEEATAISKASATAKTLKDLRIPSAYREALQDPSGDILPAVQLAIYTGRKAAAHHLIASNPESLEARDIFKRKPSHVAAAVSDLETIELIRTHDPSMLKSRDIFSMIPLSIAACKGSFGLFKRLFELGSPLRQKDHVGRGILFLACGAGHCDIVQYLIDGGYFESDDIMAESYTTLYAAAAGGHEQVVQLLIDRNAPIRWYSGGQTAQQVARKYGHSHIVNMLARAEQRQQNDALIMGGHLRLNNDEPYFHRF